MRGIVACYRSRKSPALGAPQPGRRNDYSRSYLDYDSVTTRPWREPRRHSGAFERQPKGNETMDIHSTNLRRDPFTATNSLEPDVQSAADLAAIAQTDEIGSKHSSVQTSNVPKITDNAQPGVEPTDGRIYGQMTLPQPEATVGQAKQLVKCLSTAAREASSGLAGSIRQDPYSAAPTGRASLGSFFSGGPGRMSRPGLSRARRTALNRLGVQSRVALDPSSLGDRDERKPHRRNGPTPGRCCRNAGAEHQPTGPAAG